MARSAPASGPAAGTKIDIDTLRGAGLGTMTDANLATVANLKNVAAAAGGLTLTDTKITGTIPAINFSGGGTGSGGAAAAVAVAAAGHSVARSRRARSPSMASTSPAAQPGSAR